MTGQSLHNRPPASVILLVCAALLCAAFVFSLGVWQVQRLQWKLDLIERVETRVKAGPVTAPGPTDWPALTAENSEYLKVEAQGRFLHDKAVFTQALTELGSGHWLLTPLETDQGFTVLVNRGFVAPEDRQRALRNDGSTEKAVTVVGLLRISEPDGGFLRENNPEKDLWYSRDVVAIAHAKGLSDVAPYFIDADASLNPHGVPVGGLTRISFANNHLVYALTWFGLTLMLVWAGWYVLHDWRRKRAKGDASKDR